MWYRNLAWGIYWLSSAAEPELGPPAGANPSELDVGKIEERPGQEGDWLYDSFEYVNREGQHRTFHWMCSPYFVEPGTKIASPGAFPEQPTYEAVAAWFKKAAKTNNIVKVSPTVTFGITENGSYDLRYNGNRLLIWSQNDSVTTNIYPNPSSDILATLQKYLGKLATLTDKEDIYGIKIGTNWCPLITGLSFNLKTQEVSANSRWFKEALEEYRALKGKIELYGDNLTSKTILSASGPLSGEKHAIMTRCKGCTAFDSTHLMVHLDRMDFDLFLLYAAFEMLGKEALGGAARLTWDVVEEVRGGNRDLADVKEIIGKFFLLNLRDSHVIFKPIVGDSKQTKWRRGSWKQYRVVEGQFVPREGAERLRQGEIIAEERHLEAPPIRFNRDVFRERQNAVIGNGRDLAAQVRRLQLAGRPQRVRNFPRLDDNAAVEEVNPALNQEIAALEREAAEILRMNREDFNNFAEQLGVVNDDVVFLAED